jgi:exonuclease III
MKALLPCPTFSKIAAPNSTTTSSIINHHHYTSPNTQTSNQTETKYLSSLKGTATKYTVLTLNVRSVFTSQHDLKHTIATNTPNIMVLTETKLQKGNKPQPWLHQLLTNYKWWTSTSKSGGTIIGDVNATTSAHDRTSTNKYIADKMYQDFIKDHNLSPQPHHSPFDTNLPE